MVLQKPCKRQSYLYKENNMNLAITGSSGNIGGMVAQHLSTRDLPLILPLRNPAKSTRSAELRGAAVCLWRFGAC